MASAPYGTWPSPLSAQVVASQGLRLGYVAVDGGDLYWLEGRPHEGGRTALVRRAPDGSIADVTPADANVRSRVNEYGGGSFAVSGGTIYYANFADQRIYRLQAAGSGVPIPITPPGPWRYADFAIDAGRGHLFCVREDHGGAGEAVTALVRIPLSDEQSAGELNAGELVASGYDFYTSAALSPDGAHLAWLAWRHPQMPWDGTELWTADVSPSGTLTNERRIAGSESESIYQPGWLADGTLCFASDRTGWWQLYRADARGGMTPLITPLIKEASPDAEFGRPQWILGTGTWACAGDRRLVVSYTREGTWHLGTVDLKTRTLTPVVPELQPMEWLAATGTHAFFVGASATSGPAVYELDLATGASRALRTASTLQLDPDDISVPRAITFPTEGGATAHAFYYGPRNRLVTPPDAERPPLIVINHGGPTTATKAVLDLQVQFWTSRGFAVLDVNYRGSSGYGREYRQALNGHWGISDVEDTIQAARFLVKEGKADTARLIVRGGSAGGYTTLAVLTFHPGVFSAGASYYGICDLEVLARDTHKFEARYLDGLVGPYPETQDVYHARSPIHYVDRLSCALVLFQGLEDKVVPPNQSSMMAAAVRAKGLPVALLTFEGEQHGFRRAETVIKCQEAELDFYGAVFGFRPADTLEPIAIDNLRRPPS